MWGVGTCEAEGRLGLGLTLFNSVDVRGNATESWWGLEKILLEGYACSLLLIGQGCGKYFGVQGGAAPL